MTLGLAGKDGMEVRDLDQLPERGESEVGGVRSEEPSSECMLVDKHGKMMIDGTAKNRNDRGGDLERCSRKAGTKKVLWFA